MAQGVHHVTLTQQQDYQFRIEFEGNMPALPSATNPHRWAAAPAPRPAVLWPRWATACQTRCCSPCASSSRRPNRFAPR